MSYSAQKFTAFGTAIWDWEPFVKLKPLARLVWIALYTTAESKRCVPGLFHGSVRVLAEAAKLPDEDTMAGVEQLLESEMVEVDKERRIIRLTMFPDACERPMNGDHIKGWWGRFITVPACAIRDAHVRTLRTLVDATSKTENFEAAWGATFGQVKVPARKHRGVRSLSDTLENNDTAIQQHLFAPRPTIIPPSAPLPPEPLRSVESSCSISTISSSGSSATSGKVNDVADSGHRVGHLLNTVCERERESDLSSFPESGRGGSGEGMVPAQAPRLALVPTPPPAPITVRDLLRAATGREHWNVAPELDAALTDAVLSANAKGYSTADLKHISAARVSKPPCGPMDPIAMVRWVTDVANIAALVTHGKRIAEDAKQRANEWRNAREVAGW